MIETSLPNSNCCSEAIFCAVIYLNCINRIYNTAVTDAASEILGTERRRKKPWVTKDVLDLCDERRDFKKKRYEVEGAKEYREANRRVQKVVKKAKEDWIGAQCEEIETCLNKNNSKRAYQLVKDLSSEKQGRSSTIQDKSGTCLTEEKGILSRWTEYCSELYNYESCGDNAVLDCSQPPEEDLQPILREEVEIAVASLKKGKSAEVDNIPAELVQAGGETMIDVLTEMCSRIWRTGEWPTPWTQSLIITLPKKGNLQLCQNYRTISLISHSSKVMLKVILNRLKPQAEEIIAENRLGSEPEEAPQNRSSTSESCVKRTSNTSRICTMSLLISKKPLTEYGTQPYGPPCGSTISVQI